MPQTSRNASHISPIVTYARDGVDDRMHQVAVLARRVLLQARERCLDRARVATRPQRLHALDLLRLERGIDLQDLERLLVSSS